jgi:hypothetical protein
MRKGIDPHAAWLQQPRPLAQILDQAPWAGIRIQVQPHQGRHQRVLGDVGRADQLGLAAMRLKRQAIEHMAHGLLIDSQPLRQAGLGDFSVSALAS